MADISLREYLREIENLIENHRIDQAASQCLNILESYPKEIATYSKLGKIFLEKQNASVAERIFQIILSVFPDDFVAHVGLSFLTEQAGQMDSAIDHMQRAFEIQPSNQNLQDELKRLYQKRDGVEPAKIRLTRAALIKMYTRSNLYEQAIAEIRLGLIEKPTRIDFSISMADMLWQSGKQIEAAETAIEVISKLPYCWAANEILDKAFLTMRSETSENVYRARLIELDPYYQYMLPTTLDVSDIPDIAVLVIPVIENPEKIHELDWLPFIDGIWSLPASVNQESSSSSVLDWSSILKDTQEDVKSESEMQDLAAKNIDNESEGNNRISFIERLQRRNATENDIPAQSLEDENARQSEKLPEHEEESIAWFDGSESAEMVPSAANLPLQEAEDNIDPTPAEISPADEKELPEESGIIDQDAPVTISAGDQVASISSAWVRDSEPDSNAQNQKENPSLDDTQRIQLQNEPPEEVFLQVSKALEGANYKFAVEKLGQLVNSGYSLNEIKVNLEHACDQHPDALDLWMMLGEIYKRLNLKEEALQIFARAQKHISL